MKLRKALGYKNGFQAIFVRTYDYDNNEYSEIFDKPKEAKRYIQEQESCTVEVLWYNDDTGEAKFDWCDYQNGVAITISVIGLWIGGITKKDLKKAGVEWKKSKDGLE